MVSVHTLLEDNTASMNSSLGSVPTEVLHPEDEDYDLDLPPYPRVFPASQFSPLAKEIWSSMSAMTNQSLMGKPIIKGSSASSATPIVLSDGQKNSNDNWSLTTSMMLSTWWETNQYSRPQALM